MECPTARREDRPGSLGGARRAAPGCDRSAATSAAAATASAITALTGRSSALAAAATSSYSGWTLTTRPRRAAIFTAIVATVDLDLLHLAVERVLADVHLAQADGGRLGKITFAHVHGGRRLDAARDKRVRRPALLHQDRRQPGVGGTGVEQPLQDHAATAAGRGRRRWSRAAAACGRGLGSSCADADEEPQHVRVAAEVAAAGSRRRPGRPSSSAAVPQLVTQCDEQRGAGRRAQLAVGRAGVRRDAAEQLDDGRRRDAASRRGSSRRCRSRPRRGSSTISSARGATKPAQTPTMSAIASSAPTSWKCTSSRGRRAPPPRRRPSR